MTNPSELERPKDSLAKVVADLRSASTEMNLPVHTALSLALLNVADRIERLDAEMRKELQAAIDEGSELRGALYDEQHGITATLRDAELAACHSLLNDPRVRAMFPALKDGAVLASCSGDVFERDAK